MDQSRRDIVRTLFVSATEVLEDNHLVAVDGQGSGLSAEQYRQAAEYLRQAAHDLGVLTSAVLLLLARETDSGRRAP